MARDVKIWKDDGSFKLRVCGIIQAEGKYLISNCDNCEFWSFPGGHVLLGENSDDAVLREVLEETKIKTSIKEILATIQLFFKREDGMPFHEIGFYYLLEPKYNIEVKDFSLKENDKGKVRHHVFKWVTLDKLKQIDVRPNDLKTVLEKGLHHQHIIHTQNTIWFYIIGSFV